MLDVDHTADSDSVLAKSVRQMPNARNPLPRCRSKVSRVCVCMRYPRIGTESIIQITPSSRMKQTTHYSKRSSVVLDSLWKRTCCAHIVGLKGLAQRDRPSTSKIEVNFAARNWYNEQLHSFRPLPAHRNTERCIRAVPSLGDGNYRPSADHTTSLS
jgi:hypothetical protein